MSGLAEALDRVRGGRQDDITSLKFYINSNFPFIVKAFKEIDNDYLRPKRRKGFNLVKVESKKHGFLYYARFSHNGKMLPTKFNTHTNILADAERFASENKEHLIEGYLARKDGRIFAYFEGFFSEGKTLYITEESRKTYDSMIKNKFLPFLKQEKITSFDQIKKDALKKFQKHLQKQGLRAQTVNNNMKPVRKIMEYLAEEGLIADNPCNNVKRIKVHETDLKERGCYDLEKVRGVFNKRWKNEDLYLLCLLIYTTGMRNSEIKQITINNIQTIGGYRFLNVKKSKTDNGIRFVPLHDFVYRKLKARAVKNKKDFNSLLFDYGDASPFNEANNELARMLKVSDEELKRENITFYSGRHFWKTLMSAEGLGEDIEEIFMGHKVVSDVKKLYNHRDKQGKERLVKKAEQVFEILDRCIFKTKPRGLAVAAAGAAGEQPPR